MGTIEDPGIPSAVVLHLSPNQDGSLNGAIDDLTAAEYDNPVRITMAGRGFEMVGREMVFDGALSNDGSTLEGMVKPRGFTDSLFYWMFGRKPVHASLHRVDPSALPHPPRPQSLYYTVAGRRIHYMQMPGSSKLRIVFLHGSPGDWSDWGPYLTDEALQREATLIAVDRPGFGESEPGEIEPDLRKQAQLLEPLLHPQDCAAAPCAKVPTIVVGWSMGGPVAAEMAMDYPQEVQGAVLFAPAIDPATGGALWYNEVASFWPIGKLVSWVLGPSMMWSNREIMPLGPQLAVMEPRWKTLTMPVTVVQGDKDTLVDPKTADFAERVLPKGDRVVRVPGAEHDALFSHFALGVETIGEMANRVSASYLATGAAPTRGNP